MRITSQDTHVDEIWLLQCETCERAGLKGGSGLVIRPRSGLRTVCSTYVRCFVFFLPEYSLKSGWGGLRGRETATESKTASCKWRLGEFSFACQLQRGQQWVRRSWHDSWHCGRVVRVHLRCPRSPHPCRQGICLGDTEEALLCFGAWNWTAVFRSADAHLTVFTGTVVHQDTDLLMSWSWLSNLCSLKKERKKEKQKNMQKLCVTVMP